MTKTLSEIKAEAGRDLDSSLADSTLVPGEASNFGAFSFGALWNWIKGKCATVVQSGNTNPVTSGAVKSELDASYYNKQSVDSAFADYATSKRFILLESVDLNTLKNSGRYFAKDDTVGNGCLNKPQDVTYAFYLEVISENPNKTIHQIFHTVVTFFRSSTNGGNTWTSWQKLATEGDLVKSYSTNKSLTFTNYVAKVYPSDFGLTEFKNNAQFTINTTENAWGYLYYVQEFTSTVLSIRGFTVSATSNGTLTLMNNVTRNVKITLQQ